jgi:hypothetical protein
MSKRPHVQIYFPNKKSDRSLFWVAKWEPQQEPKSLAVINPHFSSCLPVRAMDAGVEDR